MIRSVSKTVSGWEKTNSTLAICASLWTLLPHAKSLATPVSTLNLEVLSKDPIVANKQQVIT